jgi:hypothetical protein
MTKFAPLLLVALLSACGYSDGDRVGTIQKFTYKGLMNKSWEGELALDGFKARGEGISNVVQFSVTDRRMVQPLEDALKTGAKVRLTYSQDLIYNPFLRDSGYVATKVEVMK